MKAKNQNDPNTPSNQSNPSNQNTLSNPNTPNNQSTPITFLPRRGIIANLGCIKWRR